MHDLAFFKVPKGTSFSLSFPQFKAKAKTQLCIWGRLAGYF